MPRLIYSPDSSWMNGSGGGGGGGGPASTNSLAEGNANLYFTQPRVLATTLANLSTASSADVTSSDSVLTGFGKLQAKFTGLQGLVRASVLTGYTSASTYVISASDNVLGAFQKVGGFITLLAGGTSGQVLKKNSSADYDVSWGTVSSGAGATNIGSTPSSTGIALTSSTGTGTTLAAADTTNAGLMVPAQVTKLSGLSAPPTTTDGLSEGSTHLYFTQARTLATPLAGMVTSSTADVSTSDTVLTGFGKLQAKFTALTTSLLTTVLTGYTAASNYVISSSDTALGAFQKVGGLISLLNGGTSGQVLTKNTNTAYDFTWATVSGGGGGASSFAALTGVPSDNTALTAALAAKDNAPTTGTTITASRLLTSADIDKVTTVDTSAGAVTLTLNANTYAGAFQKMTFYRSGANALTFVGGGGVIHNPNGIVVADQDYITLYSTGVSSATVIGTDQNTVKKTVANAFTKSQSVANVTLTYASTVNIDASLSNNFRLTLAGSPLIANPTNMVDGQGINILFIENSTGGYTPTFGTKFRFSGNITPAFVTTASNSRHFLSGRYDGTSDTIICSILGDI